MKKYGWEIERDSHYASILEETNKEMKEWHDWVECSAHIDTYWEYRFDWVEQTVRENYIPF